MLRESLLVLTMGLIASATACGSDGVPGDDGADSGNQGSGATGGTGATYSSAAGGALPTNVSTGEARDLTQDEVCAGVAMETESVVREIPREVTTEREVPSPVAIYVMLDNSKSMGQTSDGTHTTWEQAEIALSEFVRDPASEGIDVGIQYFHPKNVAGKIDECNGVAHAQSAIAVGRIPEVASAVVDSLASTGPQSNTPTVGALTGAVDFCVGFQEQHPDEQCVVVFVTDGQPNGCGLTLDCTPGFTPDEKGQCVDPQAEGVLSAIAAAGARAGVKTYTVGMVGVSPDGFALLDALAVAGGTDCTPTTPGEESCNTSSTGGAGLLAALNLIRDTIVVTETETFTETVVDTVTIPCSWDVPAPPAGETLDPGLVNVRLVSAGQQTDLGQVTTPEDCKGIDGWYYDVPEAPTSIQVCPQTCATLEGNPAMSVSVVFGCKTKPVLL